MDKASTATELLKEKEEHYGQLVFDFAKIPNHEGRKTFEEAYVGESREDSEASEKAIGNGSEGNVTPEMRTLFFGSEGWYADDPTVFKWFKDNFISPLNFDVDKWADASRDTVDKIVVGAVTTKQIGGDHYKNMAITPTEYIVANGIGWSEGNIIKYISRHGSKNGREDVEKALHYCELILKGYDEAERLHSLTN